jgi:hypothetical protein
LRCSLEGIRPRGVVGGGGGEWRGWRLDGVAPTTGNSKGDEVVGVGGSSARVGERRREPGWVKVGADRWAPNDKFKLIQNFKFCSNLVC